MKHKSILILFLFLVTLVACIATTKAEPPNGNQIVELPDIDTNEMIYIAQDYPQNDKPNEPYQKYNGEFDVPIDNRYGLVGFVVLSAMGLVGYVVKSDRQTMNNLVASIKENSDAMLKQATATEKLAERLESRIEQVQADVKSRFESLDKALSRLEQR